VEDGALGPLSLRAVLTFQRAHGLKDDGVVGPKTLATLGLAVPVPPAGPLLHEEWPLTLPAWASHYFGLATGPSAAHGGARVADRESVRKIQRRLIALGFNVGPSGADGWIGLATQRAIVAWQRSRGAVQSGLITKSEWVVLFTY